VKASDPHKHYFFDELSVLDSRVFRSVAHNSWKKFTRKLTPSEDQDLEVLFFLKHEARTLIDEIADLHFRDELFHNLLDYARELGASERQIKGDRKALSRWLDQDALSERYAKKISINERSIIYFLRRIAYVAEVFLSKNPLGFRGQKWNEINIQSLFEELLFYDGDERIRVSTFESFANILGQIPYEDRPRRVSSNISAYLIRFSQDRYQSTDLQEAALGLLSTYSHDHFSTVAEQRLEKTLPEDMTDLEDDFFVRSTIVGLLCRNFTEVPNARKLLFEFQQDSGDFVRQKIYRSLPKLPLDVASELLQKCLIQEKSTKVRASAILMLSEFDDNSEAFFEQAQQFLVKSFASETDEYCTRCMLNAVMGARI